MIWRRVPDCCDRSAGHSRLPEATARTLVLTMESQSQSASELQEVLKWKIERGFSAPLEELSISKERLQKDAQGRDRYLVIAVKKAILAEYEAVLESLGWRAGLILPRHLGEAQWLMRNGAAGDSLLVSGSSQGLPALSFATSICCSCAPLSAPKTSSRTSFTDCCCSIEIAVRRNRARVRVLMRLMVIGEGITKTTRRRDRQRNDWRRPATAGG
jgi:hypothetical protein